MSTGSTQTSPTRPSPASLRGRAATLPLMGPTPQAHTPRSPPTVLLLRPLPPTPALSPQLLLCHPHLHPSLKITRLTVLPHSPLPHTSHTMLSQSCDPPPLSPLPRSPQSHTKAIWVTNPWAVGHPIPQAPPLVVEVSETVLQADLRVVKWLHLLHQIPALMEWQRVREHTVSCYCMRTYYI